MFLQKPCDLLVLHPEAFEDSKAKYANMKRTRKSTKRNRHYLPKICDYSTIKGGWRLKKEQPMNILVSEGKKIMLITGRILRKQWDLAHAKDLILCGTTLN